VDFAAKRGLEAFQRFGCDGVHHLLVKARVGLGGVETFAQQQVRVVEIDRLVERLRAAVVIDDRETLADRTRLELFVAHADDEIVAEQPPQRRVERVHFQRAFRGRAEFGGRRIQIRPARRFRGTRLRHAHSPKLRSRSLHPCAMRGALTCFEGQRRSRRTLRGQSRDIHLVAREFSANVRGGDGPRRFRAPWSRY